jgi:predicted nucleic acid-binding protein
MRVFLDSSALAKRYVAETGSEAVLDWCARADELALSSLAIPEIVSALCRLRRDGRLGEKQYRDAKSDLLTDLEDALLCDASPTILKHAVRALENHPVRSSEAIHVGSALALEADIFVTSDRRQAEAARAMGLAVEEVDGG